MKKKLILGLFSIMGLLSYAQEASSKSLLKKIFFGGSVSHRGFYGNNKHYLVNISPTIGYFFADSLAFGVNAQYKHYYEKSINENEYTFKAYPFIKKYWMLDKKFMPFIEFNMCFGCVINNEYKNKGISRQYAWGFHIEPGFSYRINSSVFLNSTLGSINYDYYAEDKLGSKVIFNMYSIKLGVNFFV